MPVIHVEKKDVRRIPDFLIRARVCQRMNLIDTTLSNRYEIVRELGFGGMGVVYLARDPLLERDVAIKVIRPGLVDGEFVDRFRREARVAARMDHPAIVIVHDIGEHEGLLYFVMPFVPGKNLRAFISERSLSLGDVLDIGIQVAEALAYSHAQGVIHRDIKPENIMVHRQENHDLRVRITDFGVAAMRSQTVLTATGCFVGTLAYLSPEQMASRPAGERADLYSLGTVLYECLCGETPFSGEIQVMIYRIIHDPPVALRARGAGVDPELEAIIMRCLEKDPERRPEQAAQLAGSLIDYRARLEAEQRARVVWNSGRQPRTAVQAATPFIGRERELAELRRRLGAAIAGECQFVAVGGDAGIGKSRLLEALENLAAVHQVMVLHGRFVEQSRAFLYQGFCEAIQEYFRLAVSSMTPSIDLSDLAPELMAVFPALSEVGILRASTAHGSLQYPAPETHRFEDRASLFELLARTFARISSGKALVVMLEDLHAGDVSVDALEYVVRRLGATSILFVGTYRNEEVTAEHPLLRMLEGFEGDRRFAWIRLEPFTFEEQRELLAALLGGQRFETALAEKVHTATEGNPYFICELIRSLIDDGELARDDTGSWKIVEEGRFFSPVLPATIQQTVRLRTERLPEQSQEILKVASVLGRGFDLDDLAFLAGEKCNLEPLVDELIRAGFFREERTARGDRFTFSSGVLRDVMYASLIRRTRRRLHRTYAERLEQIYADRLERIFSQLVHHYAQADVPEKVVDYGLRLARASLVAFSAGEAERAARTVLDFIDAEAADGAMQEGEIRMLLATAHSMAGDRDEALLDLEKAIRLFQQEAVRSPMVAEIRDPADQNRQLAAIFARTQLLSAIRAAAQVAWEGRKADQTKRYAERGIELARELGDRATLGQLLSLGATVANLRGESERARAFLEEADRLRSPDRPPAEIFPAGGSLTVAFTVPVLALDPARVTFDDEAEILANVFETLVRTDAQGNLIPNLAESWESLEGGRAFLFHLRPGVTFHNGEMLTAPLVKQAIEDSVRRSPEKSRAGFEAIAGLAEFRAGTAAGIAGILARDDHLLELRIQEPLSVYPVFLADIGTAIACPGRIDSSSAIAGTGPFRIMSGQGGRVRLSRNPDYWRKPLPLLEDIEFISGLTSAEMAGGLEAGRIDLARDMLPEDVEEILRSRHLRARVVEAPRKNVHFVLFNCHHPNLLNPLVRRALRRVVNTRDMVRRTLGRFAEPAEGLLPPGIFGYDPARRRLPLSVAEARDQLQAAGALPLTLRVAVHPIFQDRYAALVEALRKTWSELGVDVQLLTPTMDAFLAALQDEAGYELLLVRYIADYDDPDNFCHSLFHSSGGLFRHYYSSAEMDRLIEAARGETRPGERLRLYRRIEELLQQQDYFLPLFHGIDYRVIGPSVRRATLRGMAPYVNYSELAKVSPEAPGLVRANRGGVPHVPVCEPIQRIDPAQIVLLPETEICKTVFETLTHEAEEARIVPWLAREFHVEGDGRRYRFRLRDDVRFHDGRRLTSRDVRFSFERMLQNPDCGNRWSLSPIHGAKALLDGQGGELAGFQIESDLDFTIELKEPVGFFPALLAHYATAIVPEGTVHLGGSWREGCVGTGPFRVVGFEPGRRLDLEANPHYWQPEYPRSDGLVFVLGVPPQEALAGFRAGRFALAWDLLPADVESLRREVDLGASFLEAPSLSTYFLVMNRHRGPFTDLDLRRRVAAAIDVETVVRQAMGRLAVPARTLIPPNLSGYDPGPRPRTGPAPEKPWSKGGELTGMIHSLYEGACAEVARELFEVLRQLGFGIRIMPFHTGQPAGQTAVVDFHLTRWIADYPDADSFAYSLLHSREGLEGRRIGSPDLDRLIERGRAETDSDLRREIYRQVEETIASQALLVPLFHEQAVRFARPEVAGFEVTFSGPYVRFEKLWLKNS